ncbi:hypothetical protein BC831DRAFT_446643 [Entophlyctis helioformis]|nr:hypothetical protein BC831DRAFT_446643 [Entophlyctis helioformis]
MLFNAITAVFVAVASIAVNAQQPCPVNFEACLNLNDVFNLSTCGPFQARNATTYQQCLCYGFVNRELCYLQCPNNSTVAGQLPSVTAQSVSTCGGVGLNPKALPQPAPWQVFGISTAAPAPTAAPTAASPSPSNNAGTGTGANTGTNSSSKSAAVPTVMRGASSMASIAAVVLASGLIAGSVF